MSILYVLAGPNGTGKTTFYSFSVLNNFIPKDLPFINVDLIAQNLGGYNETNYERANEIYRQTISQLLSSGSDFMIESNLADNRSYEWLKLIKKKGYKINLYYLSTDDVAINIGRVQRRVLEGGHNIPEEIIKTRYLQSHSYLKTKLQAFEEVYLIDNSTDTSQIQVKIENGTIVFQLAELQNWISGIISILERLKKSKPGF